MYELIIPINPWDKKNPLAQFPNHRQTDYSFPLLGGGKGMLEIPCPHHKRASPCYVKAVFQILRHLMKGEHRSQTLRAKHKIHLLKVAYLVGTSALNFK